MTTTKLPGVHAETGVALSAQPGAPGLVAQVVVTHIYCWQTARVATLGVPGAFDHHRKYRGDTIWVSPAERARGQALGGLADPEHAQEGIDAVDALAGPVAPGAVGDADLAEMDAGELVAHVQQNPGDAARVYTLEMQRKESARRKTVIRATGIDPDTGEPLPDPGDGGSADHLDTSGAGGPTAVG